MKILVTGASGFVGNYVVKYALRNGHKVKAMIRPASEITRFEWIGHLNVEIVKADLRKKKNLVEIISDVDIIIHLALSPANDIYSSLGGTVVSTENLLEAMMSSEKKRIVLVSSLAVYKFTELAKFSLLDESSKVENILECTNYYSITKLFQEKLVSDAAEKNEIQYTIVRPGAIYGRNHLWTSRLGIDLFGKFWLCIGGQSKVPLTYVENCAEAIIRCAESDKETNDIFNIIDDELPTQRYYIEKIKKRSMVRPKIILVPWTIATIFAKIAWVINKLVFKGDARVPQFLQTSSLHAQYKPLKYTNKKLKEKIGWTQRYTLEDAIKISML